MNKTFFILLLIAGIRLHAQDNLNLHRDTLRANQLLTEAVAPEVSDSLRLALLEQATALYDKYPLTYKGATAAGYLAYELLYIDHERIRKLLKKIELWKRENTTDDLHPSLYKYYQTQQMLHTATNPPEGVRYGEYVRKMIKEISSDYFVSNYVLANDYLSISNLEASRAILDELEQTLSNNQQSGKWDRYIIPIYMGRQSYYLRTKDFEKSVIFGKKLLQENIKYQELPDYATGTVHSLIAEGLMYLGKNAKATEYFQTAVTLYNYAPDSPSLSTTYNSMAQNYELMKEYDKAADYMNKAITSALNDKEHMRFTLSNLYCNLSHIYRKSGDIAKAEASVLKSFEYEHTPNSYVAYAYVLLEKNQYAAALENNQKSLTYYNSAISLQDYLKSPPPHITWSENFWAGQSLVNKSMILSEFGTAEKNPDYLRAAVQTAKAAVRAYQTQIRQARGYRSTALSFDSYTAQAYGELVRAGYALYNLTQDPADKAAFFVHTEKRKGFLLLQNLSPPALPDDLLQKETDLMNQIDFYVQRIAVAPADSTVFYENALFDSNTDLEAFTERLHARYPNEVRDFYRINYTSAKEVRQSLDENAVLVQYSHLNDFLLISVIDKQNHSVKKQKLNEDFSEKIVEFKTLLQNPLLIQKAKRERFIRLSHDLYQTLIQPIAAEIAGKNRLLIVPEGELFYVPFEVLLASAVSKPFNELNYLLKSHEINYRYSSTIHTEIQMRPTMRDGSLLAFAPVFEDGTAMNEATRSLEFLTDSLYQSVDGDRFAALPASETEVNTVAALLDNKEAQVVLTKQAATRDNLNAEIGKKSYQFLHIATHGLVNYDNPYLSALACYQEEGGVLSGSLYFAGDIQRQNTNADLVILSSCESGIGKLSAGEGLIALNRSFLYAGAKNVLFSLWKTDDRYSSKLMIDFYRNYRKNPSYTSALHAAKLKMLADPLTASPRYWAPFILIGE